MTNVYRFADWLLQILEEKNWTQSELARKAGISRSAISKVISGERGPGTDICQAIATALNIPPEDVFRQAGLLPPQPDTDPVLDELNYKLASLPIELREEALEYLNYLIEKQDRKARGTNGLKNNLGTTHAT